ncbi:hypothetical protein [Azospirillum rugosum]|uniref:Uncharacterized protein n=1 Tax=Azospirillum rugosum TaxID=416170 RepID=A0ABS4SMR7_9PROT|nr:hypothetical protein [Azospirillum rugosum]MBP2293212.1 hypothetical protein [Azospirillum rugosum]
MVWDDLKKKKEIAQAVWAKGGGDALVKVVPRGSPFFGTVAGYVTTIKYVVGRTPGEVEKIVGFAQDSKLKDGMDIYEIVGLPNLHQFDIRGYSQCPAGISTDVMEPDPMYPPGLGAPQWELKRETPMRARHIATVLPGQVFSYPYSKLPRRSLLSNG